jgi:hypothetical protein
MLHRATQQVIPNANVVAVASITNTGGLSSFSQYGAHPEIGAPGSEFHLQFL